jgi:predicted nucleotidyltransferase
MNPSISPAQLARYRASARRREQEQKQRCQQRQQKGWCVAREAAQILKDEFGARQVKLFGSMLHLKRIHSESDIDLAVKGLDDSQYLQAVARLLDLSNFSVDLVQVEHCKPRILSVIEQEGVEL